MYTVEHGTVGTFSVLFEDSQCRGMREPLLASSISGCGLEQYAEEQGEQGESVPAELSEPRNESRLYRALSGSNWKAGLSTVCELALMATPALDVISSGWPCWPGWRWLQFESLDYELVENYVLRERRKHEKKISTPVDADCAAVPFE